MHNKLHPTLIQKQGFANAAKQICKIIHGEMTENQFNQLLEDIEKHLHRELKKNGQDYKQDPKLPMHIKEAKISSSIIVDNSNGQVNGSHNANTAAAPGAIDHQHNYARLEELKLY